LILPVLSQEGTRTAERKIYLGETESMCVSFFALPVHVREKLPDGKSSARKMRVPDGVVRIPEHETAVGLYALPEYAAEY
jgi:hypothetical protein